MKLRGSQITRVDEKGRLKIPAEYKRQLDEEGVEEFFITSKDGERAQAQVSGRYELLRPGSDI